MKLVWLDVETTGLDAEKDVILEIAVSVSDLATPFDATPLYHGVLAFGSWDKVDRYVLDMHTKSGLVVETLASPLHRQAVERDVSNLLDLAGAVAVDDRDERPTLAGATVHFDRGFLKSHMPRILKRFSHRHYDVSAIKLFAESLGMPRIPKGEAHRAELDILESIAHAKAVHAWLSERGFRS